MNTFFFIAFTCFLAETWAQTSSCGARGILASGVTDANKIEIVNRHNFYRTQVANGQLAGQPKASNMKRMVWDDAIALSAQNLANSCVFSHVIATDPRWSWIGQNLMMQYTGSVTELANFTSAIDNWFSENQYFTYPNVTTAGKTAGHYKQVVWADTYTVGCGFTKFYDDKVKWYKNYVVCNYGPGGNWVGAAPYKTGPGCENLC